MTGKGEAGRKGKSGRGWMRRFSPAPQLFFPSVSTSCTFSTWYLNSKFNTLFFVCVWGGVVDPQVAQASLELARQPKTTLSSWPQCPNSIAVAGIRGRHSKWALSLPIQPHLQPRSLYKTIYWLRLICFWKQLVKYPSLSAKETAFCQVHLIVFKHPSFPWVYFFLLLLSQDGLSSFSFPELLFTSFFLYIFLLLFLAFACPSSLLPAVISVFCAVVAIAP